MTHKKIIVFTLFLIFNLSCFVGFSSEIILLLATLTLIEYNYQSEKRYKPKLKE